MKSKKHEKLPQTNTKFKARMIVSKIYMHAHQVKGTHTTQMLLLEFFKQMELYKLFLIDVDKFSHA